MKKIFSSLFIKYMITFIGIIFLSNMISSVIVVLYFGEAPRFRPFREVVGSESSLNTIAISMGITTLVISTICIFFAVRFLLNPIKQISKGSQQVAQGDFHVSIAVKGHDEVAELGKNFNLMTQALSKNEYLHKDFVSNVSHEFKTPLTSLRGYAKLLKKADLSEEKRQECLDIIISETERLSKMSANLLKLSELENDVFVAHKEIFSLDEQIRDTLVLLQSEWESKKLNIELSTESVNFSGDNSLMYQVWINILGNAIKFSPPNGTLKIRLIDSKAICVEVIDQGIGMSPDEVERVFERFYKADTSRNTTGTGLGLSICKKIIELHQGSIEVESQPGVGTKVIVVIPNKQG